MMADHFVSERIHVETGLMDPSAMAGGEPPAPVRFTWGKEEFDVVEVIGKCKGYGDCTHGGGERYLRKHWFRVRVADGRVMRLYFQRSSPGRSRPKGKPKSFWWLYSWSEAV